MERYYGEFKERIEEDMSRFPKEGVCAFVGYISAFMEMGMLTHDEWDKLMDMLFNKGYLSKEEYGKMIDFGIG